MSLMGILGRRSGDEGAADRAAKRDERRAVKEAKREERASAKATAQSAEHERLRRERHGDLDARKTGRFGGVVFAGKGLRSITLHRYWLDVFETDIHKVPLKDVQSIALEDGAELQKRLTITRLALIGVFAFAVKKKSGGEKFIVIETEENLFSIEVPRDKVTEATRMVQAVRKAMKTVQAEIAADEAAQSGGELKDPEDWT